jgi:nucleoside-diphosphate-sugar epimerase
MGVATEVSRVFVTGGSGFVGRHVITALRSRGFSVKALVRSKIAEARVAALGADLAHGDLSDRAALATGLEGCRTVLHVAGHLREWDHERAFRDSNVEGTRRLLEAATASGVRVFVQVGAAAVVMGEPMPMLNVDETLPLRFPAWAPYIATKAEAERLVLAANGPGMRTCVVRPPFIWGPGSPMLDHIADAAKSGQFRLVDGGKQPMSTCHAENVAHAVLLAAERGRGGHAYFVTDGVDSTLREVMTDLLATRGLDAGSRDIAFQTAWRLCSVIEPIWRATIGYRRAPPITRQVLRMAAMPFTVSIAKARAELGYEAIITRAEGLGAMGGARVVSAAAVPRRGEVTGLRESVR